MRRLCTKPQFLTRRAANSHNHTQLRRDTVHTNDITKLKLKDTRQQEQESVSTVENEKIVDKLRIYLCVYLNYLWYNNEGLRLRLTATKLLTYSLRSRVQKQLKRTENNSKLFYQNSVAINCSQQKLLRI